MIKHLRRKMKVLLPRRLFSSTLPLNLLLMVLSLLKNLVLTQSCALRRVQSLKTFSILVLELLNFIMLLNIWLKHPVLCPRWRYSKAVLHDARFFFCLCLAKEPLVLLTLVSHQPPSDILIGEVFNTMTFYHRCPSSWGVKPFLSR